MSEPTSLAPLFLEKGLLGIIIVMLLLVIRELYKRDQHKDAKMAELREDFDKKIAAERNARLEDAKIYRDGMISATTKSFDTVNELSRIAEFMERRENGGRTQ